MKNQRDSYEQWQAKVKAEEDAIKANVDAIGKLSKAHEFARWRVAEKCGWANSLNGQCKEGESISAYPDDVESSDLEVEEAIAKFLAIHLRMKKAKAALRKHSRNLTSLLKKQVKGGVYE